MAHIARKVKVEKEKPTIITPLPTRDTMPKEIDMSNEEQRKRVMATAKRVLDLPMGYTREIRDFAAVLLAQEAERDGQQALAATLFETVQRLREALEQISAQMRTTNKFSYLTRSNEALRIAIEALKGAEDETGRRSTDEPHAINSSLHHDAEIVAAIAKMQAQIDSLSSRCRLIENEDQNQHDSLVDHGHAIDQHREQIGTLEKRIDFHAVNSRLNGNPDDISLHELISVVDQRCALIEQVLGGMTEESTFEKIDGLTEAVLMLLDEHKADKQGMRMWGSGDFERMANKLREMKGGE